MRQRDETGGAPTVGDDVALRGAGGARARTPSAAPIRTMDQALAALDAEFEALYSHTGRPWVPPEYLLRATLQQILYSVRSKRLPVEQID